MMDVLTLADAMAQLERDDSGDEREDMSDQVW